MVQALGQYSGIDRDINFGFANAIVSTKRINLMRNTPGSLIWQRNYYEQIVRSEESLRIFVDIFTITRFSGNKTNYIPKIVLDNLSCNLR